MRSNVFITGQGFDYSCHYVCKDLSQGEILAVEGVRGHDLDLMIHDFGVQHGFMPEKEKPVFHAALSFPTGEVPDDKKLVEISRKYLQEIEASPTQYAIVKHTDTDHLHVHIVANRVDNEGKPAFKGLVIERGEEAAKKLTKEYGLRQEEGKHLDLTNMEALHDPDARRYRLYTTIQEQLPACLTMEDLEKRLLERGITTRFRVNEGTGEREGVSFHSEGLSFKGSQVDASCSYRKLEERLGLQREERLRPEMKMGVKPKEEVNKQKEKLRQEEVKQQPEEETRQRPRLRLGL